MTPKRLAVIVLIFLCTAACWFLLGSAMSLRTRDRSSVQGGQVADVWGPSLVQAHPEVFYLSPTGAVPFVELQPESSRVEVTLTYRPKRKGLLWYRTYQADFLASYVVSNPSKVRQTIYVRFKLPAENTSFENFKFDVGESTARNREPVNGLITEAVLLTPGQVTKVNISYQARGTDHWQYAFGGKSRIHNFSLTMLTNFREIDFPAGSAPAADPRVPEGDGYKLQWTYPDVLGASPISMPMPRPLNAGPVAARMSFFAPVSLLFFFTVLLLACVVRGVPLHPANYFFLAAGFFAFQLLFAYLVDLVPVYWSFAIAAIVSLLLVSGYVHLATRGRLTLIALVAQSAYMVLFSASFFVDGLTGITITVGAIATLALLMATTARIDWSRQFGAKPPPPLPT